jgi:hypothetical protein
MTGFRPTLLALALCLATSAAVAGSNDAESIDKVNGSIQAVAGQSYGDLSTVNGSIEIDSGAKTGDAETVNGHINVADHVQCGDLTPVNGGIHVDANGQVGGGIETVNGGIFVDRGGRVAKDITTVNGAIGLVATDLVGGIDTVNGDVTVGVDSHVHGGLRVEKPTSSWLPISIGKRTPPRIVIGPRAVVDGPLVFEREVRLYVHSSARVGKVTGATAIAYSGDRPPQD